MTDNGWDIPRAYSIGRQMVARGVEIHEPRFEIVASRRMAEALVIAFWDGVRDQRADDME